MDSASKAKEYIERAFDYVVREFLVHVNEPDDIELELETIVDSVLDERAGVSFESEIDLEEDEDESDSNSVQ